MLILYGCTARAQNKIEPVQPVTFKTALNELLDVSTLPLYLSNTQCAQVSSYDTTGGNDDGFSGRYSYLRRNTDSTLVIFDVKGPGVINRIWTPTPSDDILVFYLDNLSKPAFTIRYRDLFTGRVFPFVLPLCGNQLGGFYSYLPIPFQERCMIVIKARKTQFHQIQYRLYPTGTSVKKFNPLLDQEEKLILEKLKSLWSMNSVSVADLYPNQATVEEKRSFELHSGQTQPIFNIEKGGRILGIEFEPASAFEGLAKQIDIRITWDKEKSPGVLCPFADFFGYAFGKISMKSILIGTRDGRNYSYFPMPFDRSAVVELIFRQPEGGHTPDPVAIRSRVLYSTQARKAETEGKFYSSWRRSNPTTAHQPHVFLQAAGKGHLVGTLLQAQGLMSGMTYFFEGDDSTAIDSQFRMHGTGSEDYFNGGWYALPDRWDAAMSLPLSGALDYSLLFCRTGGFRLFLSDKISFENSLYHSIEHGPIDNTPADYTSVSYYYSNVPPVSVNVPSNSTTKVFMPDTLMLYPQLMNLGIDGEISIKPSWAYATGGETFFCTVTENSALRISLSGVPTGTYRLYLDDVTGPEGCSLSIWQRQTQVSGWMDRYESQKERKENSYLCDVNIDALINSISIRFKSLPHRNQFIFNRLILIRK